MGYLRRRGALPSLEDFKQQLVNLSGGLQFKYKPLWLLMCFREYFTPLSQLNIQNESSLLTKFTSSTLTHFLIIPFTSLLKLLECQELISVIFISLLSSQTKYLTRRPSLLVCDPSSKAYLSSTLFSVLLSLLAVHLETNLWRKIHINESKYNCTEIN